MTELAAQTPQGVPPSYTHLKYSKIPALKTLTQNIGSCCQWRVHVVVYYVRMTRTGWYNLPGSECSIPEREHSLVPPYNTQMDHGEEQIASYLTVLKIQQHTQHCITHIPAQRPGYLHLVISCIFTDQTLSLNGRRMEGDKAINSTRGDKNIQQNILLLSTGIII